MKIAGTVALVTGADRGVGRAFAAGLVRRAAAKVYGAARHPEAVTEPGVIPVGLDITDPGQVAAAARRCADVSLLVNNAGVMKASSFIETPTLDPARLEMETNYFGTLSRCCAFAPVLAANGGGAVVNMLSVTSFYTNPLDASYGGRRPPEWAHRRSARSRWLSRPSTRWRPARLRYSPTIGPGSLRPRCRATMSSSTPTSRRSGMNYWA
jgi:NAD(P)-dependent dehydrogenase (short-subunit alcohol dehydrogenase family)